jgi:MYXO-CTERM domain-containing protein
VAGTAPNSLQVTFGGSTLFNGSAPANDVAAPADYVQYTFNAKATSTSTVLAFSGKRTAGGEILLDDVSVTASPEPAAWLLTSGALLGLGALRRRTNSV